RAGGRRGGGGRRARGGGRVPAGRPPAAHGRSGRPGRARPPYVARSPPARIADPSPRRRTLAAMRKVTREEALDYHSREPRGKIEVVPTKPTATQLDL